MSANEILAVVSACLALVATYGGAKWQQATTKVSAALGTVSDLTGQLNQVVIAAKDGNVDEAAFQKVVSDVEVFLKDL